MSVNLLRHCESVFNKYGRDDINCELTEFGKDQASKLEGSYDLIIVSPLKRCRQTLLYSKINGGKVMFCDLVREYKVDMCDFLEGECVIFETEKDLLERVDKFKIMLKQLSADYKKILVVTHGDFIWYMTARRGVDSMDSEEKYGQGADNGEIIEYSFV